MSQMDNTETIPASPNASAIMTSLFGGDAQYERMVEEERYKALIARSVYRLRIESGLTQSELAERIGVSSPIVSQLEDADYEGNALTLLDRIARALKYSMRLEFVRDIPYASAKAEERVPELTAA